MIRLPNVIVHCFFGRRRLKNYHKKEYFEQRCSTKINITYYFPQNRVFLKETQMISVGNRGFSSLQNVTRGECRGEGKQAENPCSQGSAWCLKFSFWGRAKKGGLDPSLSQISGIPDAEKHSGQDSINVRWLLSLVDCLHVSTVYVRVFIALWNNKHPEIQGVYYFQCNQRSALCRVFINFNVFENSNNF